MIPLLLIPQMILSGLLFNFDKLNNLISTKGKVPMVADFMASRWAYEALATDQFINNAYESPYFEFESAEAKADFKAAYLADELKKRNRFVLDNFDTKNDSVNQLVNINLNILRDNLKDETFKTGLEKVNLSEDLVKGKFSKETGAILDEYFESYRKYYQKAYNDNVNIKEKAMAFYEKNTAGYQVNEYKNRYYNESLADLVKNVSVKERLLEYKGKLIQQINPIFQDPKPSSILDYRAAFFVPKKHFLGVTFSTFVFNTHVIWVMAAFFYVALYFEWLRKFVGLFEKMNLPKKK